MLAPNAEVFKFSSLRHKQWLASQETGRWPQDSESISEQHKGQRVLLAENTFLKSVTNTINIKLDEKFRRFRKRTVEVLIRKENIFLNNNKISAVAGIYIS